MLGSSWGGRSGVSRSSGWLGRDSSLRGLIYLIVGALALEVALGIGGRTTNQRGALEVIARQPLGTVLLAVVAVALAVICACGASAMRSSGAGRRSRIGRSTGSVRSAVASPIRSSARWRSRFVAGSGSGQGGAPKETAGVLGWPGGTWIVGVAGVLLFGVALYQGYRGVSRDFLEDSKTESMSPRVRRWVEIAGTVGHLARMVVFGMIGVFLVVSAVNYDPRRAVGLDGALATLAHSPGGPVALGVVAAGFVAFALYSISDARYRRI